jgi:hypothetical protein
MAVNLRKVYCGKQEVSKKNRPYSFQLDYKHNGKRIRETIKGLTKKEVAKVSKTAEGLFVEVVS